MKTFTLASAVLAATALSTDVSAETVDLLRDLAVTGTVTTTGSTSIDDPLSDEPVRERDESSDVATAFADFPLFSDTFVVTTLNDQDGRFFTGASGGATARLSATRSDNSIEVGGSFDADGSFRSLGGATGSGTAGLSFIYEFTVSEDAAFDLSLAANIRVNGLGTGFGDASLVRIDDGAVLAILKSPDFTGTDSSSVQEPTAAGLLGTGSAYRLSVSSFIDASGDDGSGGGLGAAFSVASLATPVPSPAALPAGVALLGGLLARRRR